MKIFFTRFKIMLKRTIKQPIYIIMLISIVVLSFIYVMIPSEKKSLYIYAAVFCEDKSPEAELFMEKMISSNSVFSFYRVDSMDELKNDVITGKANSGFVIPENYINKSDEKIIEYVTAGSFLPRIAFEEVYVNLFGFTSYKTLQQRFEGWETDYDWKTELKEIYDNYSVNERLFDTNLNYEEYTTLTKDNKTEIPIRKILGLFIYIAAILGTAAYITDRENNIYLIMGRAERISLRFIHILASVLPLSITGFFVLLLLNEMTAVKSIIHIILYMVMVAVVSLVFGLLFKKSSTFYKFLPILLVFNLILSGVFFDLGKYNTFALYFERLCPPYYF
ncbi:MAG: ABC transporter permease [Lachnospiraceae bacterium]|nr:ABC transporter permease [Lachnospiraceae bacterium]